MVRLAIAAGAALAAALAGCSEAPPVPGNQAADTGADEIQRRIEAMPEGQRNAVFIRAIRDADQPCEHVESSTPAGRHQGFPVWNAQCAGGGTWTIVIGNDGTAQILNAAEAQLIGDHGNEAAPQNRLQEP